jgi:hypothetical protein
LAELVPDDHVCNQAAVKRLFADLRERASNAEAHLSKIRGVIHHMAHPLLPVVAAMDNEDSILVKKDDFFKLLAICKLEAGAATQEELVQLEEQKMKGFTSFRTAANLMVEATKLFRSVQPGTESQPQPTALEKLEALRARVEDFNSSVITTISRIPLDLTPADILAQK